MSDAVVECSPLPLNKAHTQVLRIADECMFLTMTENV